MRGVMALVFVVLVAPGCANRRIAQRDARDAAARTDDGSPVWEQHTLYAGMPYYLEHGWTKKKIAEKRGITRVNPISLRAPVEREAASEPTSDEGSLTVGPTREAALPNRQDAPEPVWEPRLISPTVPGQPQPVGPTELPTPPEVQPPAIP